MKYIERDNNPTPHGGAYSEIHYFDENGKYVEPEKAKRCIIRECDKDGNTIFETHGVF